MIKLYEAVLPCETRDETQTLLKGMFDKVDSIDAFNSIDRQIFNPTLIATGEQMLKLLQQEGASRNGRPLFWFKPSFQYNFTDGYQQMRNPIEDHIRNINSDVHPDGEQVLMALSSNPTFNASTYAFEELNHSALGSYLFSGEVVMQHAFPEQDEINRDCEFVTSESNLIQGANGQAIHFSAGVFHAAPPIPPLTLRVLYSFYPK